MAFEELIEAIGEAASRQRAEILAKAEEEAGALLREAEAQREGRLERARARGAAAARREASRIESRARIGAKRQVLAARYELVEETLRALESRLRALAGTAEYRALLAALLGECLAEAEGPVTVRCRPEDRAFVEAEAGRHAAAEGVEEAPFPLGGVETASGPGGSFVCRNSFADRIERLRPLLLQEAGRLLFGPRGGAVGP